MVSNPAFMAIGLVQFEKRIGGCLFCGHEEAIINFLSDTAEILTPDKGLFL
jgi:hypothetical protein